jgi:DNA (cytosine-5)-methyltransferase 1
VNHQFNNNYVTFGDLFAGGGGVTTGALSVPGIRVLWALNHDEISIKTHEKNHPETIHYQADIRQQNEKELDPVDILWASLECTNYSNAKGGQPRDADSRTLAWELPRYIKHCRPSVIIIENVREFLAWGPLNEKGKPVSRQKGEDFSRWIKAVKELGYINVDWRILNAADFGCHTRRERLFIIFTRDVPINWKEATHHPEGNNLFGLQKWRPVKECIDLDNHGRSIFGRKKPLSENTLRRIAGGIKRFYPDMCFLMKYYNSSCNPESQNQSVNEPCHSVTTKDRFALVNIEKKHFMMKYYSGGDHVFEVNGPLHTITTIDHHALISVEKKQFITDHIWGGRTQGTCEPLKTQMTRQTKQLITCEKFQFISAYFNSSGRPETQNQSLDKPLNTIMTANKYALVSGFDFDIKMRFLTPDELAKITGFPEGYFDHAGLNISKKYQVKMIGNAVPVNLAAAVIEPMAIILENIKFPMVANI